MSIEFSDEVAIRLGGEQMIWLTTTKADGTPLPNPVWFLWNSGEFVVLTVPDSVKWKNMRRNPSVAFNFNTISVDGSDVAIFQARANLDCAPLSDAEFQAYLTKYERGMEQLGLTREILKSSYQPVRFKLLKYRTVTG